MCRLYWLLCFFSLQSFCFSDSSGFLQVNSSYHGDDDDHASHDSYGSSIIIFFAISLFVGSIIKWMIRANDWSVQYTVVLLVYGCILGLLQKNDVFYVGFHSDDEHTHTSFNLLTAIDDGIQKVVTTDPHLLLSLFLPPLIFEASYSIDWHTFRRTFFQSALAATAGLFISAYLTAVCLRVIYPDWNEWSLYLLLGVILSATDPVAVVALLKEMGAPATLAAFIEGESLLNDGTAVVLATVLGESIMSKQDADYFQAMITFLKMAGGGALSGLIWGYFLVILVGKSFNNGVAEISMTIASPYLCFLISENVFHISGVFSVVFLGLYFGHVGRTAISPGVEHFLDEFWELLSFIANTIIFILIGVLITDRDYHSIRAEDYWKIAVLYFALNLIRLFTMAIFHPAFKRIGYNMSISHLLVSSWGGLRGAISLTLTLILCETLKIGGGDKRQTTIIFYITAKFVFLTLLVNGSTFRTLCNYLKITKVSRTAEEIYHAIMLDVQLSGEMCEKQLKLDPLTECADWETVRRFMFTCDIDQIEDTNFDLNGAEQEVKRRFLFAMKASYWEQFRQGTIGKRAVRDLIGITNHAIDDNCSLNELEKLRNIFSLDRVSKIVRPYIHTPVIGKFARQYLFGNLKHYYDCTVGFVTARYRALEKLKKCMVSKHVIFEEITETVMNDVKRANMILSNIHRVLPELSYSITSCAASMLVLNYQRNYAMQVCRHGLLSPVEYSSIERKIERNMQKLQSYSPSFDLPDKINLLSEVSWLKDLDEESRKILLGSVTECIYEPNDVMIQEGAILDDIFIIARGLVNVDAKMGKITLGVGSVIGEISWVTKQARKSTVTASTLVICLKINGQKLHNVTKRVPEVNDCIWHTAGSRIAENLLIQVQPYCQWDLKRLRNWIDMRWCVVNEFDSDFILVNQPVVLLTGIAVTLPVAEMSNHDLEILKKKMEDIGKKWTIKNVEQSIIGNKQKEATGIQNYKPDYVKGSIRLFAAPKLIPMKQAFNLIFIFRNKGSIDISLLVPPGTKVQTPKALEEEIMIDDMIAKTIERRRTTLKRTKTSSRLGKSMLQLNIEREKVDEKFELTEDQVESRLNTIQNDNISSITKRDASENQAKVYPLNN